MALDGAGLIVNGTGTWSAGTITTRRGGGIALDDGTLEIGGIFLDRDDNQNMTPLGSLSILNGGKLTRKADTEIGARIRVPVMNQGGDADLTAANLDKGYYQNGTGTLKTGAGTSVTGKAFDPVSKREQSWAVYVRNGTIDFGGLTTADGNTNDGVSITTSTLTGAGILTGDAIIDFSTVIVGGAGAVGVLEVRGNLDLANTTLKMDVAGAANYDQLKCTAVLRPDGSTKSTLSTLGTTLEVSLIGNPVFAAGNTLTLVTAPAAGSWQYPFPLDAVTVPDIGGGLSFTGVYLADPNNPDRFALKVQ